MNTGFGHFADSYAAHVAACGREALNPLVASYGRALVDRAALDALLKLRGVSFFAGHAGQYRRHGAACGGARPRRLRLFRDAGRPVAGAPHPCAAHRRAGRSDHRGGPGRARRRRPAGDAGGGRRGLWPPLLEAEGRRRRRGRYRPALPHRRGAGPAARLPRLARRQRAICRCGGRRGLVGGDAGGAAAGAALRLDPLYRATGEAGPGARDRHGGAGRRAPGHHRRERRRAGRLRAGQGAGLCRRVEQILQGRLAVA